MPRSCQVEPLGCGPAPFPRQCFLASSPSRWFSDRCLWQMPAACPASLSVSLFCPLLQRFQQASFFFLLSISFFAFSNFSACLLVPLFCQMTNVFPRWSVSPLPKWLLVLGNYVSKYLKLIWSFNNFQHLSTISCALYFMIFMVSVKTCWMIYIVITQKSSKGYARPFILGHQELTLNELPEPSGAHSAQPRRSVHHL